MSPICTPIYQSELSHSIVQWESFVRLGDKMSNSIIEDKIEKQKADQCALLIYTVSYFD